MFNHELSIRVRYSETDQMGFVYYGNYAAYFEVARVEALRSLGFPYRRIEEDGVMLPVHDLHVRYHRPARYDDALTIKTRIETLPTIRVVFHYDVYNEAGELLTEATTTLVFVDATTKRPCRAPAELIAALEPYFS